MASTFISLPVEIPGSGLVESFNGRTGAVDPESGDYAAFYQPLDSDLTAIAGLASTGLVARTGSGTAAARSVAATSPLTITNGDGVAGNPTMAIDMAALINAIWDQTKYIIIFDDFVTGTVGDSGVSGGASGTGAQTNVSPSGIATNANPGVFNMLTGTTSGGLAYLTSFGANTNLLLGGGLTYYETIVKLSALSDGTDTYTVWIGPTSSAALEPSAGVYFKYTHSLNGGNWVAYTATGGSRTPINSNVAASTDFVRLGWVMNAAGTSVEFFINGVSIGVQTLTIPTTTALYFQWSITKSAGTTSRTLTVDAYKYIQTLNVPRNV